MGRWQYLSLTPRVLVDSAHNQAGLQLAMTALEEMPFDQLHIVFGTVNDKDLNKILPLLPKAAIYYFAKANIPRGLDARMLKEKAKTFDLYGRAYSSVKTALLAAKRKAREGDLIYVGGSIFIVAEVL